MVISQILGGLGNQMFQYAAARALALFRGETVLVDLSGFNNYSLHHGYELQKIFSIEALVADNSEIRAAIGWRASQLGKRLLKRSIFSKFRGKHFAVEPQFNYWTKLSEMHSPTYLMGYWQSARYFDSYDSEIRKDFTFRLPLVERNAKLAIDMAASQSISFHIRRGDYINHKPTSKIMHVCSLDYYRDAVQWVSGKVANPVFYVFSDDMEWVRRHIDFLPNFVLVDFNREENSFLDMQLMSSCKHHIIANSSFSWWGAWLNPNVEKIVIAPQKWFCNGLDDSDLIPSQWIRL